MKRILYITLAAAMTFFAACTESQIDLTPQTPGSSRSYIFFEPEVVEQVQTRTTMVEGTTLPAAAGTAFGVYGYVGATVLFDDTRVYRSSDDALFSYDGLVGWLDATTTHNFYAYYPHGIVTEVDSNNVPYIPYTQLTDREEMVDILTATYSDSKTSVVPLEFHHRLWALDITVKNNREKTDQVYDPDKKGYNDIGNDVKINSITIEFDQIPANGNIYMDGNVSTEGTKSYISEVYSEPLTLTAGTLETLTGEHSYLFLPCGSFNYRITLECTSTFGTDYTIHHPHTYVVDEKGEPALDENNKVKWHWATAKGPNNAGFEGGYRYTLDIVKSDFDVTFNWVAEGWEEKKVEHEFS